MKKSKLIELLGSFSGREWSNFQDFVASPYFNRNQAVTALCVLLREQAPAFESVERSVIFVKFFPNNPIRMPCSTIPCRSCSNWPSSLLDNNNMSNMLLSLHITPSKACWSAAWINITTIYMKKRPDSKPIYRLEMPNTTTRNII